MSLPAEWARAPGTLPYKEKYKGRVSCVTVDGVMYYPSYVVSRTAIHGYRSVPVVSGQPRVHTRAHVDRRAAVARDAHGHDHRHLLQQRLSIDLYIEDEEGNAGEVLDPDDLTGACGRAGWSLRYRVSALCASRGQHVRSTSSRYPASFASSRRPEATITDEAASRAGAVRARECARGETGLLRSYCYRAAEPEGAGGGRAGHTLDRTAHFGRSKREARRTPI